MMAAPAFLRLPWRAFNRSVTTNPSAHLFRAQCSATPSIQVFGRRHASDAATTSPLATTSQSIYEPSSTTASAALTNIRHPTSEISKTTPSNPLPSPDPRLPRAVQAVYLRPLRRQPTYGVPVCDLQLRSYSIRNLEFFCDFALRAAYYLNLPASGPVPLPRIVERWTVPKSSFIYKKAQENFERRTVRRLIQIKDGDVESVQIWLAFLRKHAYYGIGMKANVWEFTKLGVGRNMDVEMEKMKGELESTWERFAFKKGSETEKRAMEIVNREDFRAASGMSGPMIRTPS